MFESIYETPPPYHSFVDIKDDTYLNLNAVSVIRVVQVGAHYRIIFFGDYYSIFPMKFDTQQEAKEYLQIKILGLTPKE